MGLRYKLLVSMATIKESQCSIQRLNARIVYLELSCQTVQTFCAKLLGVWLRDDLGARKQN